MNPLPHIYDWLTSFPYHDCCDMPRVELVRWASKRVNPDEVDLLVDCLIQAGIGNEEEQKRTVVCKVTRDS